MATPAACVITLQNDAVLLNGVTHNIHTLDNVAGNRRTVWGTLTLNAGNRQGGYIAGGSTFDPTEFGLSVLDSLELEPGRAPPNGTDNVLIARLKTATPFKGSPNPLTPQGLIQAYWCAGAGAPLVEVTGGTDLSDYTFSFTAHGVA